MSQPPLPLPRKTVNDVDLSSISAASKSLDYIDAGIKQFNKVSSGIIKKKKLLMYSFLIFRNIFGIITKVKTTIFFPYEPKKEKLCKVSSFEAKK